MDSENNFLDRQNKNRNRESGNYFNNIAELNKIREEVAGSFGQENQNFRNSKNIQSNEKMVQLS
ncbi:hypothetical protein [Leptotrichia hofstadii]|nr:hypothetical protein [Leptotrichia hofstadii]